MLLTILLSIVTLIFLIISIVSIWAIIAYNKLVKSQVLVREAWSGIDVQLKRRVNLIPNLVNTVKGYAEHEKDVLNEVTQARQTCQQATTDVGQRAQQENMIAQSLKHLFAVAESYPDLKANENYISLQNALKDIESEIQMARRYHNGAVREYNTLYRSFPNIIFARTMQFELAEFFEISDPEEKAVPTIDFSGK